MVRCIVSALINVATLGEVLMAVTSIRHGDFWYVWTSLHVVTFAIRIYILANRVHNLVTLWILIRAAGPDWWKQFAFPGDWLQHSLDTLSFYSLVMDAKLLNNMLREH